MQNIIKHITSYFLVLLILAVSMNINVNKMTCLLSGKIKYSLEKIEDCSPVKDGNTVSRKCCDFDSISFDYDVETVVKANSFNISQVFTAIVCFATLNIDCCENSFLVNFYSNSSPPISGYDLLKLIQVFRL